MPSGVVRSFFRIAGDFWARYRWRGIGILISLLAASLAEGLGLLTLLPLLKLGFGSQDGEATAWERALSDGLAAIGLKPSLTVLAAVIVLVLGVKAALSFFAQRHVGIGIADATTDLRQRLMRSLAFARWDFLVQQPVGRFANSLSTEASTAAKAYLAVANTINAAAQIIVYVVVAFLISILWTLGTLTAGLVLFLALNWLVHMSQRAGDAQARLLRALVVRFTDGLSGMKALKAMGREAALITLLERELQPLNQALKKQVVSYQALIALQEPLAAIILVAGLLIALALAPGAFVDLLVMAIVFYRLLTRFNGMQQFLQQVAVAQASYSSVVDAVREAEAHPDGASGGGRTATLQRALELSNVRFGYAGKSILRDLSLRIPAGSLTTIIGPSGAGKTTLIDVIVGLLQPNSGVVMLDGVSLAEIDLNAWRGMVGYVPQEMFLFNDTVLANVTLNNPMISRADVDWALDTAGMREVVAALPQGVDTLVGERGQALSGGQRQRLAIARAIAPRPALLILDEATTSLDPDTERRIVDGLSELKARVTILAISHQPAMAAASDQVLALDQGRIVSVAERASVRSVG
jgi:ATP-binding cassette, subfamily C, bacterial